MGKAETEEEQGLCEEGGVQRRRAGMLRVEAMLALRRTGGRKALGWS